MWKKAKKKEVKLREEAAREKIKELEIALEEAKSLSETMTDARSSIEVVSRYATEIQSKLSDVEYQNIREMKEKINGTLVILNNVIANLEKKIKEEKRKPRMDGNLDECVPECDD